MGAKSRVSKLGCGLAVRIPKTVVEQWGVDEGSVIEIISHGEDVLLRKRRYSLDNLIADMDRDRQGPVQDWGSPHGSETW